MKYFFLLIIFVVTAAFVKAQTAEDSVKAVINQLFTAMKNPDPLLLKSSFTDSAILQSVAEKNGKVSIINESINDFANSISKLPKDAADERIQFDLIKIDGALAIAWTPYKFYYKGNFSHCGVDSYQLVRINGAWKIQYLIDTRRKEKCE